ncbi:MAG TPA: hypothetical protein VH087_08400 [Thermoanaerobaculia bacterium]|nr:hypothetical protein [Thermoanaerobaculia bacterium]
MKRNFIAIAVSMLVAAAAAAQMPAPVPRFDPEPPHVLCPHPIVLDIQGEKSAPAQDPTDLPAALIPLTAGSQWNQTAINKAFADTFHFPMDKQCCAWTKGTLTMQVKALQSGPSTSTSVNDAVTVYSNKVAVPPQAVPWTTSVTAGQTKTLTFNIPASALALGKVSFYVEDDTAVVWAHLHLEGCCIR